MATQEQIAQWRRNCPQGHICMGACEACERGGAKKPDLPTTSTALLARSIAGVPGIGYFFFRHRAIHGPRTR